MLSTQLHGRGRSTVGRVGRIHGMLRRVGRRTGRLLGRWWILARARLVGPFRVGNQCLVTFGAIVLGVT